MLSNTPFFPIPGLKKILLVGKFIHPLTSFIKPTPLEDKIGQKLADLHKGTIIVTKARHCFIYRRFLPNKRIKWFTDNQNVVSIINKGSMKRQLQDIAISILCNCLNNNISIDEALSKLNFS
jgi:hypothetical protein